MRVLLFILAISLQLNDSVSITTLYTIPAEVDNLPNFGDGSVALFSPDGNFIYYGDNSFGIIRVMRKDGREIRRIGRKGNGPGEYQNIQSMVLSPNGEDLHVLDYRNARIVTFNAQSGEYKSTTVVNFPSYLITTLQNVRNEFILVGSSPRSDAFFHRFNQNGDKLGEFGSMLDYRALPAGMNQAKEQLTQGYVVEQNNEYLGISHAPLLLQKFNQNFEQIQSGVDPIIPKPWDSHIKISSDEYYVGFYPRVAFAKLIDRDLILLSVIWPDEKKHVVQLLNFRTLKEITRVTLDYKLLRDVVKVSNNTYHVLLADPETLDMEVQEWIMK